MVSVKKLKRHFYTDYPSPFERFNEEATKLVSPNSIVLHAGCGADDSIGFRTKAKTTIGIDLDDWILHNSDIDLGLMGNINRLPLVNECVDVVVARWVLEHLRYPRFFIQETARILRPGGYLLIITPNQWHYAGFLTRFTPHSLQKWFVKHLLGGNPDEVFPTFYKANTARRLKSLANETGLVTECVFLHESAPTLLGFSPFTYLGGIVYERTVNRFEVLAGLKSAIIAIFCK
ncbi:MAG: class I SAM-dependent methyltransferase [Dehalococcoidia bacterium]|nr:MAG: class I SAM-dependent methyltransferase [Dehalococcoidia bacterium]